MLQFRAVVPADEIDPSVSLARWFRVPNTPVAGLTVQNASQVLIAWHIVPTTGDYNW